MTIGERIAPMIVIVTIVIVTHILRTCVGHPQNPLLPHPHNLLFAFIVVVQSIDRWSAKTVLKTTERKVAFPTQYPVGTPETDNGNLPQRLATVHIKPMLGPKIVKKLRTTSDKSRRPETGRQHQQPPQCPTRGKPNNKNNFPYRDYRYSDQPRQTRFDEEQNQRYSPHHFAPSPALSAGSDLLSRSIMQLAETQSRSLEIFAAPTKISNRGVPRTN